MWRRMREAEDAGISWCKGLGTAGLRKQGGQNKVQQRVSISSGSPALCILSRNSATRPHVLLRLWFPQSGHGTVDRGEIIFAGSPSAVFDNTAVIKTIRG